MSHSFRWCPAFTWGARGHLHKCCMTDQHNRAGINKQQKRVLLEHFCVCGAVW
jgi:hypothetical protein